MTTDKMHTFNYPLEKTGQLLLKPKAKNIFWIFPFKKGISCFNKSLKGSNVIKKKDKEKKNVYLYLSLSLGLCFLLYSPVKNCYTDSDSSKTRLAGLCFHLYMERFIFLQALA